MSFEEGTNMAEIEARLAELGIELPDTPPPIANYVPGVRTGNLVYLSGLGPASRADGTSPSGKVGRDLTTEEGYEAARLTGLNIISRMKGEVGDLDKVRRVIKLLGMVNSDPSFNQQPAVINGCSEPAGRSVRRQGQTREVCCRNGGASQRHPRRDRGHHRGGRLVPFPGSFGRPAKLANRPSTSSGRTIIYAKIELKRY